MTHKDHMADGKEIIITIIMIIVVIITFLIYKASCKQQTTFFQELNSTKKPLPQC